MKDPGEPDEVGQTVCPDHPENGGRTVEAELGEGVGRLRVAMQQAPSLSSSHFVLLPILDFHARLHLKTEFCCSPAAAAIELEGEGSGGT